MATPINNHLPIAALGDTVTLHNNLSGVVCDVFMHFQRVIYTVRLPDDCTTYAYNSDLIR